MKGMIKHLFIQNHDKQQTHLFLYMRDKWVQKLDHRVDSCKTLQTKMTHDSDNSFN